MTYGPYHYALLFLGATSNRNMDLTCSYALTEHYSKIKSRREREWDLSLLLPGTWGICPRRSKLRNVVRADIWLLLPFQLFCFPPGNIWNSEVGLPQSSVAIIHSRIILRVLVLFLYIPDEMRAFVFHLSGSIVFCEPCSLLPLVWIAIQLLHFVIAVQPFLNLPNSFLVSSSYISMVACSPIINFYSSIMEAISFCILLCKQFPKMFLYCCRRLLQTLHFIRTFRKILPLFSFAEGFRKPHDEMFPVALFNKEKISIWTPCLLKFKVRGLSLALNSLHWGADWILFSNMQLERSRCTQLLDQFLCLGSFYLIWFC